RINLLVRDICSAADGFSFVYYMYYNRYSQNRIAHSAKICLNNIADHCLTLCHFCLVHRVSQQLLLMSVVKSTLVAFRMVGMENLFFWRCLRVMSGRSLRVLQRSLLYLGKRYVADP